MFDLLGADSAFQSPLLFPIFFLEGEKRKKKKEKKGLDGLAVSAESRNQLVGAPEFPTTPHINFVFDLVRPASAGRLVSVVGTAPIKL